MNIRVQVPFWIRVCLFYPRMGLLDHLAVLFLIFKETSLLFSIVAVLIYIPTSSEWGFPVLHTLLSIYYLKTFDGGHSDQCEVIGHGRFDLHFQAALLRTVFPYSYSWELTVETVILGASTPLWSVPDIMERIHQSLVMMSDPRWPLEAAPTPTVF